MTTIAQVRSAWSTDIFQHASVQALTPQIYDYDITLESTKEFSKLRHQQRLNYMVYLVTRAQRPMIMGQFEQIFTVKVRYTKEADVAGAVYKQVGDFFETLQNLVQSELGSTWNDTIAYYRVQNGPPNIVQQELENLPVWVGTYDFIGYQLTG